MKGLMVYIFDMGGVVACDTNVLPAIAENLNLSLDELYGWTREFGRALSEGRLSTREFWQIFSERSGTRISEDLFRTCFNPRLNMNMVSLIEHLKQHHRVVCGTNTIAPHYAHHRRSGDYDCFDAVYASHIMGIAKPRIEFYTHILNAEEITASQSIFIDDRLENVEAARQTGIQAIHFTGYEALREMLK